jgi:hypothetical protein
MCASPHPWYTTNKHESYTAGFASVFRLDLGLLDQGTKAAGEDAGGSQALLVLHFLEKLFPKDGDVSWGADADPYLAAFVSQNDDLDLAANQNGFAGATAQNEHNRLSERDASERVVHVGTR